MILLNVTCPSCDVSPVETNFKSYLEVGLIICGKCGFTIQKKRPYIIIRNKEKEET